MATRLTTFQDAQTLTAAQLNNEFNEIFTNITNANVAAGAGIAISKTTLGTFTDWTDYIPTIGGFSANPTGVIARYCQIGKVVIVMVRMPNNGTSNSTSFTVSAPIVAATITNMSWYSNMGAIVDGGSGPPSSGNHYVTINSNSSTISLLKDGNATGWTASGGKRASFSLTYEVA